MSLIGSVEVDESALEQVIANYLEYNSYMTHSGVTDVVEEHVKDNLDISGEVESALEGYAYQTESDVEALIENAVGDFVTGSEVKDMIDERTDDGLDEDDVARIVSELDRNDPDRKDLERRFEMYAQRVDDLLRDVKELGATVHDGGEKASEPTVQALLEANEALVRRLDNLQQTLHSQVTRIEAIENGNGERDASLDHLGERIEALEQRQEIFAERLGDARVGDALTLMDLLRRAAAILGIGGRA